MFKLFEKLLIGINLKRKSSETSKILELAASDSYERFNIFTEEELCNFLSHLAGDRNILDDDFLDMFDVLFFEYGLSNLKKGTFSTKNVSWEKDETLNICVKNKMICLQSDLNKNFFIVLVKSNISKELRKAIEEAQNSLL